MITWNNQEVVPIRQINELPYVCTMAMKPPSSLTYYSMPLNSTNGRHQANSTGTTDVFKFFPSIYGHGYRWNGTTADMTRIEALVSLHVSCDVASCPAFGYQSMGGSLVTRNCAFSNGKVTPYLASSANVIHRTEHHALGTSLTTGTTGYELTMDTSTLWYAQHQVRYNAFAFYLIQAYCYGNAPTIYEDCLHWRINNYAYGEHEVTQKAGTSLIEHLSTAGLNTYSYIIRGNAMLVDSSMPSSVNTLLRLSRANMPKLEITVPDGCYVQVRSFGYRLTPYDSNEWS